MGNVGNAEAVTSRVTQYNDVASDGDVPVLHEVAIGW